MVEARNIIAKTPLRVENLLVGLVALALLPWIGWTMLRGVRGGRLPIARAHVTRDQRPGGFNALLALYTLAFFLVAAIAADLLLNLGFRSAL